jgi:hypothetical protein
MIVEHDTDGRITHVISDPVMPEVREHYLAAGAIEAEAVTRIDTHYVADGEVKERPVAPIGVTVNGCAMMITGAPEGSTFAVVMDGQTVAAAASFEIDEPGALTVVVTPPWPYMEYRHDIEIK